MLLLNKLAKFPINFSLKIGYLNLMIHIWNGQNIETVDTPSAEE